MTNLPEKATAPLMMFHQNDTMSAVQTMTSHEVARRLLELPDKKCYIGCMDDFGAWGRYLVHHVEDKGKYIEIGE